MKYAVSTKDIQTANHLATGNVHERTRLKIPFTGKALPEENEDEVLAALRRLALAKFKGVRPPHSMPPARTATHARLRRAPA